MHMVTFRAWKSDTPAVPLPRHSSSWYAYTYTYTYTYTYIHTYMYISYIHIYIYTYIHIYVYTHIRIYIYMYIVHVYMCIYVSMIHLYTYTHKHTIHTCIGPLRHCCCGYGASAASPAIWKKAGGNATTWDFADTQTGQQEQGAIIRIPHGLPQMSFHGCTAVLSDTFWTGAGCNSLSQAELRAGDAQVQVKVRKIAGLCASLSSRLSYAAVVARHSQLTSEMPPK